MIAFVTERGGRRMRQMKLYSMGMIAALAIAAHVEARHFDAGRQTAMALVDPASVVMRPAPIPADWILEGRPVTMAAEIAHTDDATTQVFVWQTTATRFHWNYTADEIVQIVDGDVYIADGAHDERHLGPGDVAFFPNGAHTTWRVPDHLRKIATLKRPLPSLVASAMRWMRAAKRWAQPEPAFAAD
jgi:uncharacterized cupin superfamily protein